MAGVKPSEILASHILVQFCVMLVQTAITLSFILYVFSVPCHGPLLWLALLTVLQGLAGMSFGFLISAAVDTQVTSAKSTFWSPKIFLSSSKNIFGPQKIFCNHFINQIKFYDWSGGGDAAEYRLVLPVPAAVGDPVAAGGDARLAADSSQPPPQHAGLPGELGLVRTLSNTER